MKSKNKFTKNLDLISRIKNISNNFKNNKNKNIIIISLIIVFSIYLLYFNDRIHIQDAVVSSLNEDNKGEDKNKDQDYLIENFDVAKYVDVCKNRSTHFYNLGTGTTITQYNNKNINECEEECNRNNCHIFTLDNRNNTNKCTIYKGNLDAATNVDTRNRTTNNPIQINCGAKILPANSYGAKSYSGSGYINKIYFKNNRNDISYIDPHLEESINVLQRLYSIDTKRNDLKNMNITQTNFGTDYVPLRAQMQQENEDLFLKFNTLNNDIFNINSDNSRNILYTSVYNEPDISNTILIPATGASTPYMDTKDAVTKKIGNLGGILDSTSENFMLNNLRYIILAIIMVITIIILILYKTSNLINEKILIVYITFIALLVLFITHHLKL